MLALRAAPARLRSAVVLVVAIAVLTSVTTTATPAPAAAAAATYTVVAGDTLFRVQAKTGVPWASIAATNAITAPYVVRVGQVLALGAPAATPAPAAYRAPAFASRVPANTTQVVRTARTKRWCSEVYCTVTEAWQKGAAGQWSKVKSLRSQIGPRGFSDPATRREGDNTTPSGVYTVVTTFSTDTKNPGVTMPWKRRLPTSTVSGERRWYNTWIEERGRTDGTRASTRWGLWINYNNGRLVPDRGPAPVYGKGGGIFLHTMPYSARYKPSAGCVAIGATDEVAWIVRWLKPTNNPRIVNNV